jgi:ribosomal protein S18 acetylase RimI-like enzyme
MKLQDQQKYPPLEVLLKNGTSAKLRFLSKQDGENLADFFASIPHEFKRFYGLPLDRKHALKDASKAESPLEVVLVIETETHKIGGYAWYSWEDENAEDSVFGICLRPEYVSCGAGRCLMNRLLEIDKGIGPPVMQLTCQHANVKVVMLYQKMGFKITKEGMTDGSVNFPPEPQYWMERKSN